ncbi:tRNA (cytidine(34)-2'-O)-methyltransferase [Mariprofundus erugo]|uniref:tRNA (cytidine(34)-2'-O)-methyltransferase n=1 Tax=Mariprofundus erugo TaxID=2528639 RepID=A0A5R9GV15_9PROT|nr:tRNA (cytidine(34)-2'-O)-methyltransferase [Mariprofundus erugo]TLS67872.1 tRNA (cytidine(34)-2'-O)-methyltransferase [Mariprofundus erugo]TLS73614.1 tRNA (cytidine(34)-2'-O)-methyltransferase [Mariprofundus erugo]
MSNPIHIVLVEPEIPPNTGNIARLCACTGCALHLVHPLGFSLDDRYLKRAGLDYWQYLDVFEYDNWDDLRLRLNGERNWFGMSSKASKSFWDVRYKAGDVLVFGPETRGLSQRILADITPLTVPMRQDAPVRSLNLSTACGITLFEALRQLKEQ